MEQERQSRITRDQFEQVLEERISILETEITALMEIKARIEDSIGTHVVSFYLDEETNEVGIDIKPKQKMGFLKK